MKMKRGYWKLVFVLFFVSLSSCKVGRFFIYNFADIRDYKKFQSRALTAPEETFEFHRAATPRVPKKVQGLPFDEFLEKNRTVAFMIIRNDTIHYENYFKGYDTTSIVPSFSMAKSVTSILIGCAIDEGLIGSVQEPITKYIPEMKGQGFDKVTIRHVLQMTSGIKFNESYTNPFGHAASIYYGRNLRKQMANLKLEVQPGTRFQYVSGNTQLLGLILERALIDRSVTSYLQEKLWEPLDMEYDASWSIDRKKDGMEKTFCCLNARARDFAKIGRLYLNNGNLNGKQIVSADWVGESIKLDTAEGSAPNYQYQWWQPTPGEDFSAEGILGQYIYVHPEKNLVIVRLGKNYGDTSWKGVFKALASKVY